MIFKTLQSSLTSSLSSARIIKHRRSFWRMHFFTIATFQWSFQLLLALPRDSMRQTLVSQQHFSLLRQHSSRSKRNRYTTPLRWSWSMIVSLWVSNGSFKLENQWWTQTWVIDSVGCIAFPSTTQGLSLFRNSTVSSAETLSSGSSLPQ